jgi:hypothetical protein
VIECHAARVHPEPKYRSGSILERERERERLLGHREHRPALRNSRLDSFLVVLDIFEFLFILPPRVEVAEELLELFVPEDEFDLLDDFFWNVLHNTNEFATCIMKCNYKQGSPQLRHPPFISRSSFSQQYGAANSTAKHAAACTVIPLE